MSTATAPEPPVSVARPSVYVAIVASRSMRSMVTSTISLAVSAETTMPARIWPIARHFAGALLLDPGHDRLLGLTFFLGCLLLPRRLACGRLAPLTWGLLLSTGWLALVYTVSVYDLEWHLSTSAERVASQVVPLLFLWTGLAVAELRPRAGRSKCVGPWRDRLDISGGRRVRR